LDVDVIDVDGAVMNNPRLTLPHPSAAKRAFVLIPWLEIEPEAALPEKGSVRALLAALSPKALSPKEVEGVRLRGELSFDVKADPTP
jgi:2-amino-4-hydroxy-6-hydroxymethyldihydropteridine diphosphokinase